MNPRLFCRERGYQKALLLSYSFDPVFFEKMVLPDLWAGGSGDILAIGDRDQVDTAMQSANDQLWHLGKRYLLAGADHAGAFHPKILLRLGSKNGIVMISSGNLTSSGWGGNREVATAWTLGPGHEDSGAWLHPFLDDVLTWCSGDLEKEALRRMIDVPWLSLASAAAGTPTPVLYSTRGRALAPQLAQRWAGRQFEEVRILTGSTDESGAFLRWAHTALGIKRAVVALTPAMASFSAEKLANLPLDLRLIAVPSPGALHAKLCWFDGPDGPGAVMGSANCSAAAWLLAPNQRGNIETIVVYDTPSPDDFREVLTAFDAPSVAPAEFLAQTPPQADAPPHAGLEYRLSALQWDSIGERLLARIVPQPTPEMVVELLIRGTSTPMTRLEEESRSYWECSFPGGLGECSAFAAVCIRCGGEQAWTTKIRWIDDVTSLQSASNSARLLEPFRALDNSNTPAEQRQALEVINELAIALFNDSASFNDPGSAEGRARKPENERPTVPVNPSDLICRLEEPVGTVQTPGSGAVGSLSLSGILSLLFDDEPATIATAAAEEDDQLDEGTNSPLPPADEPPVNGRPEGPGAIEARFRDRLATQLDTFLTRFSTPEFAAGCSATQLVQAVAFPLAIALRGRKRGWVSDDNAEKWGLQVFSVLFRGRTVASGGLLRAVAERYANKGDATVFSEIVGDGTLWVVLVATLGNGKWEGVTTFIDKAVALREVFNSLLLQSSAQAPRVRYLLGKIRIEDARAYLVEVAPTASALLCRIEDILRPLSEQETRDQSQRSAPHTCGDLLWRENVGWAVCLSDLPKGPKGMKFSVRLRGVTNTVAAGFYVNVTELAARNPELSGLIAELRTQVEAHPNDSPGTI